MKRHAVPLVTMLVLLLSGCFKVDFSVVVDDDGSGRVEGLLALDAEAAAELSSIFEEEGAPAPTRQELCDDFLSDSDVPADATTEPYDEGKFCGVRFAQDFTAAEMDEVLAQTFESDGSGDFSIRRDGDGWRFDATLSDEAAGDAEFFPKELFSDAEFIVRVKLPGRQVEHNADRIDTDGTLIWELDPFDPGPAMMARTEPGEPITGSGDDGDGGSSTALIIVAVLVVVALAGGAWWWTQRRRATTPHDDTTTPPAPAGPPSAPPTDQPAGPPTEPPPPPV